MPKGFDLSPLRRNDLLPMPKFYFITAENLSWKQTKEQDFVECIQQAAGLPGLYSVVKFEDGNGMHILQNYLSSGRPVLLYLHTRV